MRTLSGIPAKLQAYVNDNSKTNQTRENIIQLVRGWAASPMVEFEGFGKSRMNIFDTVYNLIDVVEIACTQDDDEILEAVEEYVGFHSNRQDALKNLKYVFQGYFGSVVVEQAGDEKKRASVVTTYFELKALVNDLFAVA